MLFIITGPELGNIVHQFVSISHYNKNKTINNQESMFGKCMLL